MPEPERERWIEERSFGSEGLALGERLLDHAEAVPLGEALERARLAARVALRASLASPSGLDRHRRADIVGRAGFLEVRSLRRRGRLDEARGRFAEIEAGFEIDRTPLYFWLTLAAEHDLTAGLLARDAGRLNEATSAFTRAGRIFRLAATEEDDFELLHAQARTDLLRGDEARAVDRLTRAGEFRDRERRISTGFLRLDAALRTSSPNLARHAALGLLVELGGGGPRLDLDRFRVAEAAVRLAEGQPTAALEGVTGPAERLRAAGSLLGSLRAALVACRAELGRRRLGEARSALAAGVLEAFTDLPEIPSVRSVLAAVAEHAQSVPDPSFLRRLELWLVLAEDSPGIAFPSNPNSATTGFSHVSPFA